MDELDLVITALRQLHATDRIWGVVLRQFNLQNDDQRAKWWYLAKVQAKKGVPAMVTLQQEVLRQRIKS